MRKKNYFIQQKFSFPCDTNTQYVLAYWSVFRIVSKIVPLDAKLKINYDTFQYAIRSNTPIRIAYSYRKEMKISTVMIFSIFWVGIFYDTKNNFYDKLYKKKVLNKKFKKIYLKYL